jgi:hypothetical protein
MAAVWSADGVIHYNVLKPGETILKSSTVNKLTKCTEIYTKITASTGQSEGSSFASW